jgi:hypothetical protein
MIPYEFDFLVKNGTGIIFHAILDLEMENYDISWSSGKCKYSVKEVLHFLSTGQWRQIYNG